MNYEQPPAGYPHYSHRGPHLQPANMPTLPPQVNNTNLQGHLYIDVNQILHQTSYMSYESGRLQCENSFLRRNQKESSSSDSASSPPRKKKPRNKHDNKRDNLDAWAERGGAGYLYTTDGAFERDVAAGIDGLAARQGKAW